MCVLCLCYVRCVCRSYPPLALRYFVEHELLPAKTAPIANMKMLSIVVEAMEKLGYRPEAEIAFIFQKLAATEDTSLLKDRLSKVGSCAGLQQQQHTNAQQNSTRHAPHCVPLLA